MAFFDEFAFSLAPFVPAHATSLFDGHTAGLFFVFRLLVLFLRHETFFHARKSAAYKTRLAKAAPRLRRTQPLQWTRVLAMTRACRNRSTKRSWPIFLTTQKF